MGCAGAQEAERVGRIDQVREAAWRKIFIGLCVSPLDFLAGFLQRRLARGPAQEISNATRRATSLTRQLLAFSRKQVMQPRVIDPISLATNFAPHGHVSSHVGYTVPQSCTATKLRVTVKIDKNGSILASRTATLKIIQPSPAAAR